MPERPERDLIGYGATQPRVRWPNDARVAISLVVNYEEGSENLLQDGGGRRETLGEVPQPEPTMPMYTGGLATSLIQVSRKSRICQMSATPSQRLTLRARR
jgi:hypothetical protein